MESYNDKTLSDLQSDRQRLIQNYKNLLTKAEQYYKKEGKIFNRRYLRTLCGAGATKSGATVGILHIIEKLMNARGRTMVFQSFGGCSAGAMVSCMLASAETLKLRERLDHASILFGNFEDEMAFRFWRPNHYILKFIINFIYKIAEYLGIILNSLNMGNKNIIGIGISTIYALITNKLSILDTSPMFNTLIGNGRLGNIFETSKYSLNKPNALVMTTIVNYKNALRSAPYEWFTNGRETIDQILGLSPDSVISKTLNNRTPYVFNFLPKNENRKFNLRYWALYATIAIPIVFIPLTKKVIGQIIPNEEIIETQTNANKFARGVLESENYCGSDGGVYDNITVDSATIMDIAYMDLLSPGINIDIIHTMVILCGLSKLEDTLINNIFDIAFRLLGLLDYEIGLGDYNMVLNDVITSTILSVLNAKTQENNEVKSMGKELNESQRDFELFQKDFIDKVKIFGEEGFQKQLIIDFILPDYFNRETLDKDIEDGKYKIDGEDIIEIESEEKRKKQFIDLYQLPSIFKLTFKNLKDCYDYGFKYINLVYRFQLNLIYNKDGGWSAVPKKKKQKPNKYPNLSGLTDVGLEILTIFEAYIDDENFGYPLDLDLD